MTDENEAKNTGKTKILNRPGNENGNRMTENNVEYDGEDDDAERETQQQNCGNTNKEKEKANLIGYDENRLITEEQAQ